MGGVGREFCSKPKPLGAAGVLEANGDAIGAGVGTLGSGEDTGMFVETAVFSGCVLVADSVESSWLMRLVKSGAETSASIG